MDMSNNNNHQQSKLNVCVIGAGNMGAKIAGLIATNNKVVLLDIPSKKETRNQDIMNAVEGLKKAKPNAIWDPSFIDNITVGNLEDDLELLKDCDLIIEAIVENLDIKTELFKKISPYLKNKAIVASNTSTFCLQYLKAKAPSSMQERMVITHFFNPPLHMKLLEFVCDNNTPTDVIKTMQRFLCEELGKTIVNCFDTPGFIANRVGCFLLNTALYYADFYKVRYDVLDQVFTKVFKLPSTSIFGLYDLIGIDVIQFINNSLHANLPKEDRYNKFLSNKLSIFIEQGKLGRKKNIGFYNYNSPSKAVLDPNGNYTEITQTPFDGSLEQIIESEDNLSQCVKMIVTEVVMYASSIIGSSSNSAQDIDCCMMLGYGFNIGIFEFCLQVPRSFEWLKSFAHENVIPIPEFISSNKYSELSQKDFEQGLLKSKINSKTARVIKFNDAAKLYLIDDTKSQKLCFSFATKMNTFTVGVFNMMLESIEYAESQNLPLYVYNDFKYFSVGGDLKYFYINAAEKKYDVVSDFIKLGQQTNMRIKYAKIPVICCAKGFALGGGSEMLLHSHKIISLPSLKAGLVEVQLGLIPGWGGFKEIMLRSTSEENLKHNVTNVLLASQSKTAYDFQRLYAIENLDVIMNEDNFFDHPYVINHEISSEVSLPKLEISSFFETSTLDNHSKFITEMLQSVINKGAYEEQELLDIEHDIFMELIKKEEALQKIKQIIKI